MKRVLWMTWFAISGGLSLGGLSLNAQESVHEQPSCVSGSNFTSNAQRAADGLIRSGHIQQAVATLKRFHDSCPTDPAVASYLARAESEAGDPASAEALLKEMLSRQDLAGLHSTLGAVFAKENKNEDAAAQFQSAAKMEPTEAHIFDYGTALMKVSFSAATQILEYGLKIYPSSIKLHVALALALYAQDRSEEGARLLCAAADFDSADVHPMEVLADTGIVPEAVQQDVARRLDELRKQHPNDGLLLFDYAMVKSGRWSGNRAANPPDLVPSLNRALALNPKLPKAYFELALIFDQKEEYGSEIAALQQPILLSPSSEQFHYRLAFAYRSIGNMNGYKAELARYTSLHTLYPPVH